MIGMVRTLSHTPAAPRTSRFASAEPPNTSCRLFALAFALTAVFISGCDASREQGATASGDGARSDSTSAANAREDYAWPQDPDHPILRIEIEGAAGPGTIEIELMPELAPKTVAQFVEWAEDGFYDGTTFHRVIKDFMIQGGDPNTRDRDPTNDGKGGPGFTLEDEFSDAPFLRGVVGFANTGRRDSAGSQFFIMQRDTPSLDGSYTVIGRVRSGIEYVDAVTEVEIDAVGRWGPRARPIESVVMTRIRPVSSDMASRSAQNPRGS